MQNSRKAATTAYRERRKGQGLVRLEMQVRREDAPLLRSVANALLDPMRAAEVRVLLRARLASPKARSLKELFADAPLDGIDLDRRDDLGREVELCDRNVAAWYGSIEDDKMLLSVLVAGEIRKGSSRRDGVIREPRDNR